MCAAGARHTFPALSERFLSSANVETSRMAGKARPWRWEGGNCKKTDLGLSRGLHRQLLVGLLFRMCPLSAEGAAQPPQVGAGSRTVAEGSWHCVPPSILCSMKSSIMVTPLGKNQAAEGGL